MFNHTVLFQAADRCLAAIITRNYAAALHRSNGTKALETWWKSIMHRRFFAVNGHPRLRVCPELRSHRTAVLPTACRIERRKRTPSKIWQATNTAVKFQQIWSDVTQKAAWSLALHPSVAVTALGVCKYAMALRTCYCYIKQTPFFLDFAPAVKRHKARKDVFFQPYNKNCRKFKPFRTVYRHQRDTARAVISRLTLNICLQGNFLEKVNQSYLIL